MVKWRTSVNLNGTVPCARNCIECKFVLKILRLRTVVRADFSCLGRIAFRMDTRRVNLRFQRLSHRRSKNENLSPRSLLHYPDELYPGWWWIYVCPARSRPQSNQREIQTTVKTKAEAGVKDKDLAPICRFTGLVCCMPEQRQSQNGRLTSFQHSSVLVALPVAPFPQRP